MHLWLKLTCYCWGKYCTSPPKCFWPWASFLCWAVEEEVVVVGGLWRESLITHSGEGSLPAPHRRFLLKETCVLSSRTIWAWAWFPHMKEQSGSARAALCDTITLAYHVTEARLKAKINLSNINQPSVQGKKRYRAECVPKKECTRKCDF